MKKIFKIPRFGETRSGQNAWLCPEEFFLYYDFKKRAKNRSNPMHRLKKIDAKLVQVLVNVATPTDEYY